MDLLGLCSVHVFFNDVGFIFWENMNSMYSMRPVLSMCSVRAAPANHSTGRHGAPSPRDPGGGPAGGGPLKTQIWPAGQPGMAGKLIEI